MRMMEIDAARRALLSGNAVFVPTVLGIGLMVPTRSVLRDVFAAEVPHGHLRLVTPPPANDNGDRFNGGAQS